MVRLILAFVLAGWSSLIFFQTENLFLFQLTLGATEYGHWFALISLVVLLSGLWKTRRGKLVVVLSGAATLAFSWPICSAFRFALEVPAQMQNSFPEGAGASSVFSFAKLWRGTSVTTVEPRQLTYASHAAEPLSLYFFPAAGKHPAPCIIVLHSGGWFSGTPREFEKMNSWLAESGYAVAAIQYRFAPRWTWPAQRDDVRDAMAFLSARAASLGIDPTQFVLLGRSAGGQIAEASAYGLGDPNIRGCIGLYAPADLHFAYRYARSDDILNSLKLVRDYMGGTPDQAKTNYDSASAILLARSDSPPTLLMHGTPDQLVWVKQSRRFASVLLEKGAPHAFIELPWATHAFDYNFDGPGGQITRYAVGRFLANICHRDR